MNFQSAPTAFATVPEHLKSRRHASFSKPSELEGPVNEFREAIGLLKFVTREVFKDRHQFENFGAECEALCASVRNLVRDWDELEAEIVSGGLIDGIEGPDAAINLLEFVTNAAFGSCFEKLFPIESDAIHCAAVHTIVEWRELAEAIERHNTSAKEPANGAVFWERLREVKARNPGAVVMLRMGSFYECFHDDAVLISNSLGVVLTQRRLDLNQHIPMCGVPLHCLEDFAPRLAGIRVLLCEPADDWRVSQLAAELDAAE